MEREERSCNVRLRKIKKQVSSARRKRRERKKQRHMIGEKEEKERGK